MVKLELRTAPGSWSVCYNGKQHRALLLEVRDDGVGFDVAASFPGHLGLRFMRERVALLGGICEIESTPGG